MGTERDSESGKAKQDHAGRYTRKRAFAHYKTAALLLS
jgi:hypothetical protein